MATLVSNVCDILVGKHLETAKAEEKNEPTIDRDNKLCVEYTRKWKSVKQ
jgi:hypothetical protein